MVSFLQAAERRIEDENGAGAEAGGKTGSDGSGAPRASAGKFLFATGIKCSYPQTANGRRDQLDETGHYARYREDSALVRELGLRYLRYGCRIIGSASGPAATTGASPTSPWSR